MRREERVTVQGPVKEQQPDGMSHRGVPCLPFLAVFSQRGSLCVRLCGSIICRVTRNVALVVPSSRCALARAHPLYPLGDTLHCVFLGVFGAGRVDAAGIDASNASRTHQEEDGDVLHRYKDALLAAQPAQYMLDFEDEAANEAIMVGQVQLVELETERARQEVEERQALVHAEEKHAEFIHVLNKRAEEVCAVCVPWAPRVGLPRLKKKMAFFGVKISARGRGS